MTSHELFVTAEKRIQSHRTAEIHLRFIDRAGQPLKKVLVHARQLRHEFKLGANAFRVNDIADETLQEGYNTRFSSLLNYATLPFYWGGYEPVPGQTSEARLIAMAQWCKRHGITAKGHPLVWHEVFPAWAAGMDDDQVMARLLTRVKTIVAGFKGLVDIFDVVNEATVSHRFANTVGRWIARDGAATAVGQALAWAHEANPAATLLYNDFNISPEFEILLQTLINSKAPVHTIGIQSHMHKELWPIEKIWSVCETYARFGLPVHFTEATVLSGRAKAAEDDDWHRIRTDWPTTAAGEEQQLAYGEQFYTLLFSHPAVEAITWWDFSDNGSWQGAPSGLIRADMTPKPLYDWLMDAFHHRWSTQVHFVTDEQGCAGERFFFGDYEARCTLASGDVFDTGFTVSRRGSRDLTVTFG